MGPTSFFDTAGKIYQQTRMSHWDAIARKRDSWQGMGGWYHRRVQEIYRLHINPNQNILEVGCAEGNLLATLQPAYGVGVDFSEEMICRAKNRHPELEFIHADAHDLSELSETFDIIILSDLVNDLWDMQRVFDEVRRLSSPTTRLIINVYSHLWEIPLAAAQKLNLATPNLDQN
jgi:ubiquinone/menaquinone biosynthesis C-methylase UbiE